MYRDGVRKMLEDASCKRAPDIALFTELVGEPSGHIREVLRELHVDPDDLVLDDARTGEADPAVEQSRDYRRFVPAAPDAVWALVSDPDRWLEWNGFEFERVEVTESGVLRAHARQLHMNGKPARVRPQFRVSEHVVSRYEPPNLIQWERSFPDTDRAAGQSLRVSLKAQGWGAEITVSLLLPGGAAGRAGLGYWLMRPLAKLLRPIMVRAYLRGKADNISRALRQ